MASRRMFSIRIVSSARFLKMPISSQALYFHLGLHADDDGVVEAYTVMNSVGCAEDDLKVLVSKGFVQILNEDLVSYITDWSENNLIRADRKIDSIYKDLLISINPDIKLIEKKERADRKKMDSHGTDNGQSMDGIGKDRLGKDSIDKDNINITAEGEAPLPCDEKKVKHKYGLYNNVLLTDSEYAKLCNEFPHDIALRIDELSEYIEIHGKKYKSHLATIRAWARRENKINNNKENSANRQKGYDIFIEKLIEMRSGG